MKKLKRLQELGKKKEKFIREENLGIYRVSLIYQPLNGKQVFRGCLW